MHFLISPLGLSAATAGAALATGSSFDDAARIVAAAAAAVIAEAGADASGPRLQTPFEVLGIASSPAGARGISGIATVSVLLRRKRRGEE